MEKVFHFQKPAQLKEIVSCCNAGSAAKVSNLAKFWSAKSRSMTATPFDGNIHAVFIADNKARSAYIYRSGIGNEHQVIGTLKYNIALKWCRENLT